MKRIREDGLPKPRRLKPSIKRLIYTRALRDRDIPREYLANQLIEEIQKLGEIPPTPETTKRYISAARNTKNPIDNRWSIGACKDYPECFSPESIDLLMEYMNRELAYDEYIVDKHRFSIRTAIWMVRLKPVVDSYFNTNDDMTMLLAAGESYSSAELASEVMGETQFDTTELDLLVCNGDLDAFLKYDPKAKTKLKIKVKTIDESQETMEEDNNERHNH